ncbi:MAG: carboxymuconolactone decarboxylase family protein [Bacteroidales bacterium]|nr:carboxymuconolactone decarboxylase family protein [Bacteroidales bacterium]MCF8390871.1 carboxymuconolactone decarboxylase family protein [Bacteroidales bacterium]
MTKKIAKHYEMVKKHHPDYLAAVENLGEVAKNAGPIDAKTAQLIQLAASVAVKSEGAVHSHTKRALEAGASKAEIRHSLLILTNTLGFPNVMAGLSWVNDILD